MTDALYRTLAPAEQSAANFVLDSYLLHKFVSTCARCARAHTASNLFEVHITKTQFGGEVRRLVPATTIDPKLALGIATLRPRTQPICHECIEVHAATSPPPTHWADEDAWRETLKRKYAPEVKLDTAKTARVKTVVSISDL